MTGKPKVVIVHGAYGSATENWFPWLKGEVEKLGFQAMTPSLPTPEGQEPANWHRLFKEQCGPLTADTILVGHSLSPAFILALLEQTTVPVKGTFLVSGFLGLLGLPDFDRVNEAFTCRDFKWDVIKKNAGELHVYNSDTDPYVPLDKGRELARHLGTELIVVNGGGHINASAGFSTFPQLLEDLKPLLVTV
jgi:predicted alpha/beta hydrolase family esterase